MELNIVKLNIMNSIIEDYAFALFSEPLILLDLLLNFQGFQGVKKFLQKCS